MIQDSQVTLNDAGFVLHDHKSRLTSLSLFPQVYLTSKVKNRPKTRHCSASFTIRGSRVHVVPGSCAAEFRKLTSQLFIHVRSCSCIPPSSPSMTGPFSPHSSPLCLLALLSLVVSFYSVHISLPFSLYAFLSLTVSLSLC